MNKKIPMAIMAVIMLVSLYFAVQGINMHTKVSQEETKFHGLLEKYFILDKVTRESAPTNSELQQDLVEIQKYPSELLRLKLVGVGKILTGIYALLFGILIALVMMPIRLSELLQNKKK